jgi:hypothetical protein
MKIYSNPLYLQKIIKDNCNKQFDNLFESDVILKFDKDKDDNLILNNLDGGTINMDSSVAYLLSDYYKSVGDALKRIETITEQPPEKEYKKTRGLGILFYEPFTSFVNKEFKIKRGIERGEIPKKDGSYQDSIGGIHDEGLGWSPDGTFCGECSHTTCEGCKANNELKKKIKLNVSGEN